MKLFIRNSLKTGEVMFIIYLINFFVKKITEIGFVKKKNLDHKVSRFRTLPQGTIFFF